MTPVPIIRSKINKEEKDREKGSERSKQNNNNNNDKSNEIYQEKDGDKDRERDKGRGRGRNQGRETDTDEMSMRDYGNKNGLILHDQTMSVQAARSCVMLNVKELVTSLGSAADGITRAAVVTSLGSAVVTDKATAATAAGSSKSTNESENTSESETVIDSTCLAATKTNEVTSEIREGIVLDTGTRTGTESQGRDQKENQDQNQNQSQNEGKKHKNCINKTGDIDRESSNSNSSSSSSSSLPDIRTKCIDTEVGIWGGLHGGGPGSNMQNFVLVGTYVNLLHFLRKNLSISFFASFSSNSY